ncbi:DNA repair protein REV1 [Amphibalanus amphitrite]|uniref:DNA repair protein REV1 n=1 Tax=Amphibalanus amphitrite TaxID=1232801 RepID=A0A6A4WU64_AMPAM|nr:DNA repair protein REV1 [Amphibalanus amphitrite]
MAGRGCGKRRYGETGFEAWGGYMEAKKSKLENQFDNMPDKNKEGIFKNISIFVNGLTEPPAAELKQLMHHNGGTYHHYYRSRGERATTHIIASNLPHAKLKQHQRKLVVRPEWITESLSAGRLLDYRQYLLLPPENPLLSCMGSASTSKAGGGAHAPSEVAEIGAGAEPDYDDDDEECESFPPDSSSDDDEVDQEGDPEPIADNDDECDDSAEATETAGPSTAAPSAASSAPAPPTDRSPVKRAGQPNFLQEFYQKSRLHHISEMKALFRDYVARLQDAPDDGYPERARLLAWSRQRDQSADQTSERDGDDEEDMEREPAGEDSLTTGDATVIAHVDMDCFFVSVGLRSRPELRGRPVAVTHSRGGAEPAVRPGEDRAAEADAYRARRSGKSAGEGGGGSGAGGKEPSWMAGGLHGSMAEIASCSYEARAAGVKNGMFMGAALKLCPDLQTIPYDFAAYREVALAMYDTVCGLTRRVQAVSCDELFADCSELLRQTDVSPLRLAEYIRHAVRRETGCPASVGLGPNILLARLATSRAKPDGQFHVPAGRAAEFMLDQRVRDLPGVGRTTAEQLHRLGADSCRQLQRLELAQLQRHLGPRTGRQLHEFCRGIDTRAVTPHAPRRSVSAEVNYGIRFGGAAEMASFVNELCAELQSRMTAAAFLADSVTVKVMVRAAGAPTETAKFMGHGVCDTLSRSGRLATPTDRLETLRREVAALLAALHVAPSEVRGLGLQAGRTLATAARGKPPAAASVTTAPPPPPQQPAQTSAVVYSAEEAARLVGGVDRPVERPSLPPVPTFCGTADLSCIRRLVVEWLGSGPHPEREDEAALAVYLSALVDARLLEPARGLLVLMGRRLTADGPPQWLEALQRLTDTVQRRVGVIHGGTLSLPPLPRPRANVTTATSAAAAVTAI